jgi:hypothetical protein
MRANAHLYVRPDAYRFMPPGAPRHVGRDAVKYFWPDPEGELPRSSVTDDSDETDDIVAARTHERQLLAEYQELLKLKSDLLWLRLELKLRQLLREAKYSPDQPRVPAGHPEGGQWTTDGGSDARTAVVAQNLDSSRIVVSDESPSGIRTWAQYAETSDKNADEIAVARRTNDLHNVLTQVSGFVARRPGSSAREYGVDVHTAFARTLRALNLPGISVEQSFDPEGEVRYGKDGSIRTDVIQRNSSGNIIAIYDLKTGDAIIRPSRAAELRAMTRAGPDVPVIELHSVRGPRRR